MTRPVLPSLFALLAVACESQVPDDPEPPGVLEYEHAYARLYRRDRRIDAVLVRGDTESRACGILTEPAHAELEETLAALDPSVDYGYDPQIDDCTWEPGAWVHVEGMVHSPFSCDFQCCPRGLGRAAVIYMLVETYFSDGRVLEIDGEPYVAIDPDQPCP
ncbi:hypothetical protein [Paraliomyxa miuraensis]|uniref:hypothetical protein n=1 Tax=Paraliomyxa miuraensis TaxID=376150 RepID=UPI00224F8166|nr:hypothetical protein [Paraliomyxa miuraensis]MCX4242526.1 hypothetical protein [Paraliomyxa miuraensis]